MHRHVPNYVKAQGQVNEYRLYQLYGCVHWRLHMHKSLPVSLVVFVALSALNLKEMKLFFIEHMRMNKVITELVSLYI